MNGKDSKESYKKDASRKILKNPQKYNVIENAEMRSKLLDELQNDRHFKHWGERILEMQREEEDSNIHLKICFEQKDLKE